MDSRYRLRVVAGWQGPHQRISDDRKTAALRPLAQLIRQADVTSAGINRLAQQARTWFLRNTTPIPGVPDVTLDTLLFSVWLGSAQVVEIDAEVGSVLLFEPSH